jgi:hypothetical protein
MHAIISDKDGVADRWGDDYVKARAVVPKPPETAYPASERARQFPLTKSSSVDKVVETYVKAIAFAGRRGVVILNVGHGISDEGDEAGGMLELAPGGTMTLGGLNDKTVGASKRIPFANIFYDLNVKGPPDFSGQDQDLTFNLGVPAAQQRLQRWSKYQTICRAFKQAMLRKVVLLTCSVGKSPIFLRKLSWDWGVAIEAYKGHISPDDQVTPGRTRMHLKEDPPGVGTNVPQSEEQLPRATDDNSVRILCRAIALPELTMWQMRPTHFKWIGTPAGQRLVEENSP